MAIGAILGAVGSIAGGILGKKAADRQADAAAQAGALAREDIQAGQAKAEGYLSPYITYGQQASGRLSALLGLGGADAAATAYKGFVDLPHMQAARQEAERSVLRGASAGGFRASGNVLDALRERSTTLVEQQYQNYLGRLGGLATQGLSAGQSLGNIQIGAAGQQAQIAQNIGAAQGQAAGAGYQAIMGGIRGLAGTYQGYQIGQMINQQQQQQPSGFRLSGSGFGAGIDPTGSLSGGN